MKLRALQAYQESKFKRLKKIKSKKYRKILRKEREKEEEKNLLKLEKDDPIKFREALEQIEKKRMMERMSLKHKNTSKWAKQQSIYAKFSDRSREQVQEQLELSKKLTQKVKIIKANDDDEEEEEEAKRKREDKASLIDNSNILNGLGIDQNDNPWLKMMSGIGITKKKKKKTMNDGNDDDDDEEEVKSEYKKPGAFVDKAEIEAAKKQLEEEEESEDESDGDLKLKNEDLDDDDVAKVFANDLENDDDEEEKKEIRVEKQQQTTTALTILASFCC